MSASPWRHARKSALGHAVLSCLCNLVLLPCLAEPQQAAHNRTAGSPGPDLSCSVLAGGSKTFRVYLGHRTDLSSTRRAAESVLELGPAHITIVDQTAGFEAGRDPALQALSVEVIDAPGVFFFSGFSEFVRKHAIAKELDAYFWLHSDARLEVGVARAGLASLCALWESNMTWGAVFFKFDVFCAFSVDAVTKIGPWDSGIPHYRADSDYYRRMDRLNFTRCQNPRAQADACHGVPALRAIWPEDGFQIAHEGSIFLKRQEQEVIAEERWAYWLFDYVGRYIYFPLKWGFLWNGENQDWATWPERSFFSTSTTRPLATLIITVARLPPPANGWVWEWGWNIGKVYLGVSLVMPLLALLLLCRRCVSQLCRRVARGQTPGEFKQTFGRSSKVEVKVM